MLFLPKAFAPLSLHNKVGKWTLERIPQRQYTASRLVWSNNHNYKRVHCYLPTFRQTLKWFLMKWVFIGIFLIISMCNFLGDFWWRELVGASKFWPINKYFWCCGIMLLLVLWNSMWCDPPLNKPITNSESLKRKRYFIFFQSPAF